LYGIFQEGICDDQLQKILRSHHNSMVTDGSTLWTVVYQHYGQLVTYGQRWIHETLGMYRRHESEKMCNSG
jgi:hypothetical protein